MNATPVAVIGMAVRLPGASTPSELWDLVSQGRSAIRHFTADESAGVPRHLATHPDYVPAYGAIAGADEFDAELFGYPAREAQLTDPQQRKFLECAHEALDVAGYGAGAGEARIGIVAGTGSNTYQVHNVLPHLALTRDAGETAVFVASEKDHVATRTAHRLDLHGPALTVQTSCSTSLVAVHLAVSMLQSGEADVMLAGASTVQSPQEAGHVYSPNGVGSPDGVCRAFDTKAAGTVFASGVGVVVLKRLDDALADGDTIRAVIRGSAVNNDGSRKVGYTAPSIVGQRDVIRTALSRAGIDAASVGYVETHGTGTELGDAIELEALHEAFGPGDGGPGCVLGTLKPNIGHTDSAAGVAGLIKTVLVLENGYFPPNINVDEPHPQLSRDGARFTLCLDGRPWESGTPRRAAVSSFGLGGTNAHVVLEQAPAAPAGEPSDDRPAGAHVFPMSGPTETSARAVVGSLAGHLAGEASADRLADAAHTLQVGRRVHPWRTALVARTGAEVAASARTSQPRRARRSGSVAFAFTGFGTQWEGMARGLQEFSAFREALDECVASAGLPGVDLTGLVLGTGGTPAVPDRLAGLEPGQAAVFCVQVATARLLESWGLSPTLVLGHSLGEYAAACVAGALSPAGALGLVAARTRGLLRSEPGAMTAVLATVAEIDPLLGDDLDLAAVNADTSLTVSGPTAAVERFEAAAVAAGIKVRRLPITVAGHSSLLDPILDDFRAVAAATEHRPLTLSLASTLTGATFAPGEVLDAEHWTQHLRRTVRFSDCLRAVRALRNPVLFEIGPGQVLSNLVQAGTEGAVATVPTMPSFAEVVSGETDPVTTSLRAAAEGWTWGLEIDWPRLAPEGLTPRRTPLPGYPFQRTRHWLDVPQPASDDDAPRAGAPAPTPASAPESAPAPGAGPDAAASPDGSSTVRELVHRIWFDLLGELPADDDANFFERGGDSLRLVRLIGRLREELGVTIPLRDAASSPTPRHFLSWIENARREQP